MRRWRAIAGLAGMLLVSTGAALAVHVHDAHEGHASADCWFCLQLTVGAAATLDEFAALPVGPNPHFAGIPAPAPTLPVWHGVRWPEPRSPPAIA